MSAYWSPAHLRGWEARFWYRANIVMAVINIAVALWLALHVGVLRGLLQLPSIALSVVVALLVREIGRGNHDRPPRPGRAAGAGGAGDAGAVDVHEYW